MLDTVVKERLVRIEEAIKCFREGKFTTHEVANYITSCCEMIMDQPNMFMDGRNPVSLQ